MTFADVVALPGIACGTVDDGWNGSRRAVIWRYDPATGNTWRQWSAGVCRDHIPIAASLAESVWLLENHPNARGYRLRRSRPQRCAYCGEADKNAGAHGRGHCVSTFYTGATY